MVHSSLTKAFATVSVLTLTLAQGRQLLVAATTTNSSSTMKSTTSSIFDTSRRDPPATLRKGYGHDDIDSHAQVVFGDHHDQRQQPSGSGRSSSSRNRIPRTKEEREAEKLERSRRMHERRENARQKMREMIENPNVYSNSPHRMTEEELSSIREAAERDDPNLENEENRWLKNNNYNNNYANGGNYYNQYNNQYNQYNNRKKSGQHELYEKNHMANPYDYWDMWAQAYRMLGVYINCETDPNRSNDGNDNGWYGYYGYNRNKEKNNNNDEGCKRWVIWASYVNPNYQGNGWNEYFTGSMNDDMYYNIKGGYYGGNDNNNKNGGGCQRNDDGSYACNNNNQNNNNKNNQVPTGQLDCHDMGTNWLLMGVYREEFYDFFEQISKHMWYYDSYEYTVATTGLDYIGDGDCEYVASYYGSSLYKAPRPIQGGGFEIGLYTDENCIEQYTEDSSLNADNVAGNYYGNNNNRNNNGYDWFYYNQGYNGQNGGNVEEYTLTLFNEVFEEFKYCTLCLDYPSYQDGYFNGDGYDDDDLINQCWKFYSHDTYMCDLDCIALGDAQGTMNVFKFGKKYYGTGWDGATNGAAKGGNDYNKAGFSHNYRGGGDASFFFFVSILVFVCTCYAFYNYEAPMHGKKERLLAIINNGSEQRDAGAGLMKNRACTPRKSRSRPSSPPQPDATTNAGVKLNPHTTVIRAKSPNEGAKKKSIFSRSRSETYRPPTAPAPMKTTTTKKTKPSGLEVLKNLGPSPQKLALQRIGSPKRTVAPGKNLTSIDMYRSRSERPKSAPNDKKTKRKVLELEDDFIKNHRVPVGTKDAKKAVVSVVQKHKNSSQIKHSEGPISKQKKGKGDLRVVWESGL